MGELREFDRDFGLRSANVLLARGREGSGRTEAAHRSPSQNPQQEDPCHERRGGTCFHNNFHDDFSRYFYFRCRPSSEYSANITIRRVRYHFSRRGSARGSPSLWKGLLVNSIVLCGHAISYSLWNFSLWIFSLFDF